MAHAITKMWIHIIFSTKERQSLINSDFESKLHNHIKENLISKFKCCVKAINGTSDHIHILILFNKNYTIQHIMHKIKGESSYWVNQNNFIDSRFAWQIGYSAFSLSQSHVIAAEKYILNQKEHHRKISYSEEYESIMKKYEINNSPT